MFQVQASVRYPEPEMFQAMKDELAAKERGFKIDTLIVDMLTSLWHNHGHHR